MPKRECKKIVEETPTISLRRSSRIHRQNQTGAQSPTTPKPAGTRCDSIFTPISEIKKTGHRVSEKRRGKETESNSEKFRSRSPDLGKQSVKGKRQTKSSVAGCRSVEGSEKSGEASRRSGRANVGKEEVVEKMKTRDSARRSKVVQVGDSNLNTEESAVKFGKRATRSSSKADMKKVSNLPKGGDELSARDTREKDVEDCGIMKRNGEENRARKARIGGKRKRDGVEGEGEDARGWTKDQELHLQSAYFSVKPTPHFWKKVARMVPGKSAQECFDKIYSDHLTPPPPRTRSRAKTKEPSPLSYSASKLIFPTDRKTKRLGSKRRTLLAQKTVRKILQRQEEEDYSPADLFALLEPTLDLSTVVLPEDTTFASPPPSKVSAFLTGRRPESSSLQGKKHLSRLKGSHGERLTSPPVLKQIKNKALHEKYIDQLHCRDAKRKAALRKSAQIDAKPICSNLVKAAKDALLSDAQDAIRSLHCRNDDDDNNDDDKDEDEDDEDEDGI